MIYHSNIFNENSFINNFAKLNISRLIGTNDLNVNNHVFEVASRYKNFQAILRNKLLCDFNCMTVVVSCRLNLVNCNLET